MARSAKIIPFPLARRATRDAAPPPPALVEVVRCREEAEALVVRGLLESGGITVLLKGRLVRSIHPFSVGNQGEVAVLVAEAEAARARAILEARQPGRPRRRRPPGRE